MHWLIVHAIATPELAGVGPAFGTVGPGFSGRGGPLPFGFPAGGPCGGPPGPGAGWPGCPIIGIGGAIWRAAISSGSSIARNSFLATAAMRNGFAAR